MARILIYTLKSDISAKFVAGGVTGASMNTQLKQLKFMEKTTTTFMSSNRCLIAIFFLQINASKYKMFQN